MEINWGIIILVIIILVTLDKALTVINIKQVENNFPEVKNPLSIEKNPIAKHLFEKFGLYGGTAIYWIFSIITFLIALGFLSWCISLFKVQNHLSISLWVMFIWYGIVIANNLFFLLKFSKIIP